MQPLHHAKQHHPRTDTIFNQHDVFYLSTPFLLCIGLVLMLPWIAV